MAWHTVQKSEYYEPGQDKPRRKQENIINDCVIHISAQCTELKFKTELQEIAQVINEPKHC